MSNVQPTTTLRVAAIQPPAITTTAMGPNADTSNDNNNKPYKSSNNEMRWRLFVAKAFHTENNTNEMRTRTHEKNTKYAKQVPKKLKFTKKTLTHRPTVQHCCNNKNNDNNNIGSTVTAAIR